jgi:hypothetical protein
VGYVELRSDPDSPAQQVSFHWDGEQLFITTGSAQIVVKGADLLALTDLLARHKEQIDRHIQALPTWVIEEHQQYLKSGNDETTR